MTVSDIPQVSPTILVIDDVPANLDILVSHLVRERMEPVVALSGEDGLKLARDVKPDLILLDVMMPGMDGYEVCKQLKASAETAHIPVIFLSAKTDEPDIEYGLNLGAIDYISKPFSLPILKARLRNHLALKFQTDQLVQQAHTDNLTGLYNRHYFANALNNEWRRAIRNGQPMSLIMIDVDEFKKFNDHYGHPAGDSCLQQVANALKQVLRNPADLLARYGGEEFVVALPNTDKQGAINVAERLRQKVESLQIAHEKSSSVKHISISLGAASCNPRQFSSEQTLLSFADKQLYKAKHQGRNRLYHQQLPEVLLFSDSDVMAETTPQQ